MSTQTAGIEVIWALKARYDKILTPCALHFKDHLNKQFGIELLERRKVRQEE